MKNRSNYNKPRKNQHSYNKPKEKREFYTKENIFVSRMASILLLPKSKIVPLFSQRAKTTIRLNPLKGDVKKTKNSLIKKGYDLEQIPWEENTYFVLNQDKNEVSQSREYDEGKFYIQNLSSILASILLEPKKGERILDMCAAPGSKTTHIAALTDNQAEIIANDSEISRVNSLNRVIDQFGVKNCKVTLSDGEDFGKKYPVSFDKVLLDAPCSGEGMIYMRGPKPLRFWSIQKVNRYSQIQRKLIESAFLTLNHGGTMIYSTCTLEPEENEGVVTYLLGKYPNARIEEINPHQSIKHEKGITKWSGNKYHPTVKNSIRIIPSSEMMGFYIAKIFKE
ncbi:MAG: RNA methylase, NOL1/NOP2/sun family [candidate division WS6 bacterium 36_33]|uniref:RNA methylase, NOL1/NOP2/sun family n=1 Tax=candidate division WS6 bacterium 36_33 TaxID=1641388 RepID=A0A101GZD1_9BACT|nr:MAG: RNA methylase, NOL1/NOP2/sun family [candidate division WS6 bacterium 36_33]